ncbi:hypothetical protein KDX26_09285 [Burkholderia cenocepacia]|uniref:hypothetical protein n=1 Tax=Burkholderia cenocepacia TaxID=95486 RepID=UPI001B9D955A|nr:hypothetical protein [Burkholderia cenocepacia]MBR8382576.1 hypothetical protein [Burkholderia cenocepacia]
MHRIQRDPERFGPLELADCIGTARNIDLAQVGNAISFPDLLGAAQADERLLHGKRVENMFEYVVASLGKALVIKREDAGEITSLDPLIQPPDYRVVLKDGSEYLVEVKNCHIHGFDQAFSVSKKYLDRLLAYRKNFTKRMTEIRVQKNLLDGGNMMVVTETPDKPKRIRSVNVDTKPAKKWEELTPRQRRQELLKTPRMPKPQSIDPNPFDREEGIIPLKPIDD